ncbi:MAG: aa3-type cytochrome c oxidase subunit IV [Pseudomonadota bacterium]
MAKKHKHGTMDVTEQEKTFQGFVNWSIWISAISIGTLIFLAVTSS